MADIHDFQAASRETDNALSSLRVYGGQIEDEERSPNEVLALLLAAEAITCAIREVGTRIDYLTHDVARRF